MDIVEKQSNNGAGFGSSNALVVSESEEVHVNGFATPAENSGQCDGNSAGSSRDGFKTYTRRKRAKVTMEDGKFALGSISQVADKSVKEPEDKAFNKSLCTQTSFTRMEPYGRVNDTDGCSLEHWRNVVLEQMSQTLEGEGGLQQCIQDALALHPESCLTTVVKDSVHSCEDGSKCTSQTGLMLNGLQNAVYANLGVASNGSMHESKCHTVTELCRCTFLDVVTSEKFAQLCHLLLKSFPGMQAEKVFDFRLINSRIKDGAYESSPNLLHTDLQQVWTNIHRIGMDMVALAKSLSEKSRTSYREQVGSLLHSGFEVGKHEFFTQESDMHDKADRTEACAVYMVCTCRHCGEKADGRSCLVCDSCEGMYHVSCIEPAVIQIPVRSWYCASCTAKGIGSPHDECVVCERLNAPKSPNFGGVGDEFTNEETVMELEESSNGLVDDELQMLNNGKNLPTCNICRSVVENGEKLKICRHTFCPHKFYHVRCLTKKQLITYGTCWYCPSCLCRSCLTDRDDDKIVMCDGCDHAYHIYCMQPPRTSIPRGKWFCRKCDADIRRIRKAKKSYETKQHKLKRRAIEGKGSLSDLNDEQKHKAAEALDKSGGVEMLLSAAKTLNYEENLAALEFKNEI